MGVPKTLKKGEGLFFWRLSLFFSLSLSLSLSVRRYCRRKLGPFVEFCVRECLGCLLGGVFVGAGRARRHGAGFFFAALSLVLFCLPSFCACFFAQPSPRACLPPNCPQPSSSRARTIGVILLESLVLPAADDGGRAKRAGGGRTAGCHARPPPPRRFSFATRNATPSAAAGLLLLVSLSLWPVTWCPCVVGGDGGAAWAPFRNATLKLPSARHRFNFPNTNQPRERAAKKKKTDRAAVLPRRKPVYRRPPPSSSSPAPPPQSVKYASKAAYARAMAAR